MRIRTRTSLNGCGESSFARTFKRVSPPAEFIDSSQDVKGPGIHHTKKDTISDEINLPRTKQDRARFALRLRVARKLSDPVISRSVHSELYTQLLQVHKCSHTKTEILRPGDRIVFRTVRSSNISYTYNYSVCNALCRYFGNVSIFDSAALLNTINGSFTRSYTADAYHEPDWYALLDKWHEACDSIMPPNSLLGESIVENGIFIDAFKAIVNPSSLVKTVLKRLATIAKKKDTLGKVALLARQTSGDFLSWNFAVKPALDEVVNVFNAHETVRRRLNFLRSNMGGYLPIRARMKIPSDFTNAAVTGSPRILCDEKEIIGVISALGKVREDLDYIEDWKAYVQYFGLHKFIGLAWELVPFSFVLDWFTNAGEYVNKYLTPRFASPFYNIRNICYSKKQHLKESLWIPDGYLHSETASTVVDGPIKIGSWKISSYDRNPGLPKTSGAIDFSRLGLFHGLASGAMLIQRSPWGK